MIIFHPTAQLRFDAYVKDTPQALLLVAPTGSGKESVLRELTQAILGDHPVGRLFEVLPDPDKSSISIDSIRRLKTSIKLISDKPRVVLIPNAEAMTVEAQNSLLKVLEEPPKNIVFLLSAPSKDQLLETIVSRTSVWQLTPPTNAQVLELFAGNDSAKLQRAIAIAGGRVGLVSALLNNSDTNHPLLLGIETAKEILQESRFERLCRVESLAKDQQATKSLLEALELTTKAGLEQSAKTGNTKAMPEWHRKLKRVLMARKYQSQSVQAKLLLSDLFVHL